MFKRKDKKGKGETATVTVRDQSQSPPPSAVSNRIQLANPKRSTKINANNFNTADNDTWQETLSVVEGANSTVLIRSFYVNTRTQQREWDEPPSGASNILQASEEMRRMAELQLQDMQIATEGGPDTATDNSVAASAKATASTSTGASAVEFSRNFFRRKEKKKKGKSPPLKQDSGIHYKPNSRISNLTSKNQRGETLDSDLQKALALSLGGNGNDTASACGYKDDAIVHDDEELAIAKALSMSEATAAAYPEDYSETDALRKALEESTMEVATATDHNEGNRAETNMVGDLLGFGTIAAAATQNNVASAQQTEDASTGNVNDDTEGFLDQKMAAAVPTPAPTEKTQGLQKMSSSPSKPTSTSKLARRFSNNEDMIEQAGIV